MLPGIPGRGVGAGVGDFLIGLLLEAPMKTFCPLTDAKGEATEAYTPKPPYQGGECA